MQVSDVMTTPAMTVPPDMSVGKLAQIMIENDLRAVPVVDNGRMIGIVSEMDLLVRNAHLHFPSYLGMMESVLPIGGDRNLKEELRRVLAVTVREVMSTEMHTARPGDDLGEIAHTMLQRHLQAIPVVQDGRVEGILFPSDVVRLVARDSD
jgi:CBS domain-containing protein